MKNERIAREQLNSAVKTYLKEIGNLDLSRDYRIQRLSLAYAVGKQYRLLKTLIKEKNEQCISAGRF